MKKLIYLTLLCIISPGLQAQGSSLELENSLEQVNSLEQIESSSLEQNSINLEHQNEISPQMSPVPDLEPDQELLALAPFAEAPGVCLVINAMLADFCRSYPDDSSCQQQ